MSKFVYVTYIRTTPEKLWEAFTTPEMQRLYWFGAAQESDWKKGSAWRIAFPDGRVMDTGEILEIDPPRKLVLSWRNEFMPELKAEGWARCTITLEPADEAVKLMVVHENDHEASKFIEAVSGGWPKIFAGLKSLLETGKPLEMPNKKPA